MPSPSPEVRHRLLMGLGRDVSTLATGTAHVNGSTVMYSITSARYLRVTVGPFTRTQSASNLCARFEVLQGIERPACQTNRFFITRAAPLSRHSSRRRDTVCPLWHSAADDMPPEAGLFSFHLSGQLIPYSQPGYAANPEYSARSMLGGQTTDGGQVASVTSANR
jgi:hypothetical protein